MNKQVKRGQWIVKLEKLMQCKKCSSFFIDQISLKKHQAIHEKEIKDEIFFPSKDNLLKDEIKENKPRNKIEKFKCDKCGKMFGTKYKHQRHEPRCNGIFRKTRIRTNEKVFGKNDYNVTTTKDGIIFQCNHCERSCKDLPAINNHSIFLIERRKLNVTNVANCFHLDQGLKNTI